VHYTPGRFTTGLAIFPKQPVWDIAGESAIKIVRSLFSLPNDVLLQKNGDLKYRELKSDQSVRD
jgi:hypothetical protein